MKTSTTSGKDLIYQGILGLILCYFCLFTMTEHLKQLSFVVLLLVLLGAFFTKKHWLPYFSLTALPLWGWVAVSGASVIYASSRKFALYGFLNILAGFCLLLLLLSFCRNGKRLSGILAISLGFLSFVSIDLLGTRLIYDGFVSLLSLFTEAYADLGGVEVGVRMLSLLDFPNVYSGCAGIGVLLSLGLCQEAETKWEKRVYLVTLFVNSLGFVLSFSMGATATIILAFLAYLFLEKKEKKGPLLLLMIETLVLSLALTFPIYATAFEAWDGVNVVPTLLTMVGAVLLILVDAALQKSKLASLWFQGKKITYVFVGVVSLLFLYGLLAVTITTAAEIEPGERLLRAAYPEAGDYVLSVDSDAPVNVLIQSQNEEQTMMHTYSNLYRGSESEIAFTVPDGSKVLYVTFTTGEATTIHAATLDDGTKIPLHYPILPGFIVNRLQGLFANQNAIQRTVFFEDGMKLFAKNPLFGLGMGSFENAIHGVQGFYYETKYVHNHYIQVLLETGIVGFLCFVGMLGGFFLALWKRRKEEIPFLPTTIALLLFMASHGFVEVVWSISYYLVLVFGVFALIFWQLSLGKEVAVAEALPLPEEKEEEEEQEEKVLPVKEEKVEEKPVSAKVEEVTEVLTEEEIIFVFDDEDDEEDDDEDDDEDEEDEEGITYQVEIPMLENKPIPVVENVREEDYEEEEIDYGQGRMPFFVATFCGLLLFTALLYGNLKSYAMMDHITTDSLFPDLVKASQYDVFETQDYWSTYIGYAKESGDSAVHSQAEIFCEKLLAVSSNTAPLFVADYYFSQGKIQEGTAALEQYVSYVITKSSTWENAYVTISNYVEFYSYEEISASITALEALKTAWNEENMGTLRHSNNIQEFVDFYTG